MEGEITKIIVEVNGKQYETVFNEVINHCNNCDLYNICYNEHQLDGELICAQIANIVDYSFGNFKEIKQ